MVDLSLATLAAAPVVKSPSPQAHVLIWGWQHGWADLVALAVQVAVMAWYLISVRRLAQRGHRWSWLRTSCFALGMVTLAYAVEGGLAAYDDDNFTVHIIQHLLLMNVVPPLLAMGAPVTLALQSSKRRTTTRLLKVLHSAPARFITHPVVATVSAVATMYVYFLTPLYHYSEVHPLFHDYVHIHFVVAGCLFWWPIVGRDVLPRRWGYGAKVILLFITIPWNAFLGLAIASAARPLDAALNTLRDTQSGGDVLWGLGEVFTVSALFVIFADWAADEERKAKRADRQLDAALAAAGGDLGPSPDSSGSDQGDLSSSAERRSGAMMATTSVRVSSTGPEAVSDHQGTGAQSWGSSG